jgi:hypothetical protein
MAGDDSDRVEVDHLIRELSSPAPKPKLKPAVPVAATPAGAPAAPSPKPPAAAPAVRTVTQLPRLPLPVRRTLADRLAADAMPQPDRGGRFRTFFDRLQLPEFRLPAFPRVIGAPDRVTSVRLWVGLGVALAVAMPFWPYPKTNAWWVVFYMFAVAMVVVAGIWSARLTWATRLGIAHIVALTIVLWGITLAAEETLPLIGYANVDAASVCAAPPGSRG